MVKFSRKKPQGIFLASKAKLSDSGIFVCESLTKRRRDTINAARDVIGVKHV